MFPCRPLLPLALGAAMTAAAPVQTYVADGHYEIHIDYTPTPGNPDAGWLFSVSYDEDNDFSTSAGVVRLNPAETVLVAGPGTQSTVPNPAGVFSRFGPPGTPLWILPQNQIQGVLFLGIRTTMSPGIFQARVGNNHTPSGQGSISLRLVSIEGSGPAAGGDFATWKAESFGTIVWSFDTTDGIGAADEVPTIPVSSHTHYNWGFTRPGLYRVTFEAVGKLNSPNTFTKGRGTFLFAVPHAGPFAFSANPGAIDPGNSTQLQWNVPPGADVRIEPAIGDVSQSTNPATGVGSLAVDPASTTTYTLTYDPLEGPPVTLQPVTVTVSAAPPAGGTFAVSSFQRIDGGVRLEWPAPANVTDPALLADAVQRSADLLDWQEITGTGLLIADGVVTFTDPPPLPDGPLFYRIARNPPTPSATP